MARHRGEAQSGEARAERALAPDVPGMRAIVAVVALVGGGIVVPLLFTVAAPPDDNVMPEALLLGVPILAAGLASLWFRWRRESDSVLAVVAELGPLVLVTDLGYTVYRGIVPDEMTPFSLTIVTALAAVRAGPVAGWIAMAAMLGPIAVSRGLGWPRAPVETGALPTGVLVVTSVLFAAIVTYGIAQRDRARVQVQQREATLARINRQLDRYAGTVAHDLKTPLSIVSGAAEMLVDAAGELDDTGKELADLIRRQSQHAIDMVGGLLALSQTERVDLAELVELNALIEEVLPVGHPDVRFEVGALPQVVANRSLLAQIFQNLLDNAVMHGGSRQDALVRVFARRVGSQPQVVVEDNGRGIPREDRTRVFERGVRLHETSHGSGLGLAHARDAAERIGGHLWIDDSELGGAAFVLALPDPRVAAPVDDLNRPQPVKTLPDAGPAHDPRAHGGRAAGVGAASRWSTAFNHLRRVD